MQIHAMLGLSLVVSLVTASPAHSQVSESGSRTELRDTILALDSALFDAFNSCDLQRWRTYLDEQIEFYQDNDDVTMTRDQLEPSFRGRCDEARVGRLQRELLQDSIDVHPIQGYGAVQLGTHRFWIVEEGRAPRIASTPRFVHLWQNRDGRWQITRVISYGH